MKYFILNDFHVLFIYFLIEIQLVYSIILVSGVQHSDSTFL